MYQEEKPAEVLSLQPHKKQTNSQSQVNFNLCRPKSQILVYEIYSIQHPLSLDPCFNRGEKWKNPQEEQQRGGPSPRKDRHASE